jgi:hypothetical protein
MERPPRRDRRIGDDSIDTRRLELWFLSRGYKKLLNIMTATIVFWCFASFFIVRFVIDPESVNTLTLIAIYFTVALLCFAIRIWWIWWCNPEDNFFWVGVKVRVSSLVLFGTLVSA